MIFSENKYCKQSGASWNSPDFNIFRLRFGQFMCTSLIKMFLYTNSTSEISLQVISSSLNQRKNYVVEKVQIHRDVAKLQWTKACGLLSVSPAPARFSYQFWRSQSNEVLNKMNIFLTPVIVRYMEKNLDITKPYYSKCILPTLGPSVYRSSIVVERPLNSKTSTYDYEYEIFSTCSILSSARSWTSVIFGGKTW